MKRDAPSFTVEIRQHKRRLISENPSSSWVEAKSAPAVSDHVPRRIAAAVFKTLDASAPSEIVTGPTRSGRILPSLEASPLLREPEVTHAPEKPARQRVARNPSVRREDSAVGAVELTQSAHQERARIHSRVVESREPRVGDPRRAAAVVSPPQPVSPSRVKGGSVEKRALKTKPEPEPRQGPTQVALPPPARIEIAAEPALANQVPPTARSKRAILARYVIRGEREPGQIWKRKLLARRESRS